MLPLTRFPRLCPGARVALCSLLLATLCWPAATRGEEEEEPGSGGSSGGESGGSSGITSPIIADPYVYSSALVLDGDRTLTDDAVGLAPLAGYSPGDPTGYTRQNPWTYGAVMFAGVISGAGNLTLVRVPYSVRNPSDNPAGVSSAVAKDEYFIAMYAENTFTGDIAVNGTMLSVEADAGFGAAANQVIFNSGTLWLREGLDSARTFTFGGTSMIRTQGHALVLSGTVASTGTLTKRDGGAVMFSGTGTIAGTLDVAAGSVSLGSDIEVDAGTMLKVSAGASIALGDADRTIANAAGSGTIEIANTRTLTMAVGEDASSAVVFSGAGGLAKTGDGALTLSVENEYTGGTAISEGTLRLGTAGALGATGSVMVESEGTLDTGSFGFDLGRLNGTGRVTGSGVFSHEGAGDQTLGVALGGEASLTKGGGGTLTLTEQNTYTGGTTISAGELRIGDGGTSGSLTGSAVVASGATIIYDRGDDFSSSLSVSGAGAVTKLGAGTLIVTGSNYYTGETRILGGTLQPGAASYPVGMGPAYVGVEGTLIGTGLVVARLTGEGMVQVDGSRMWIDNTADATFSGTIQGAGGLVKRDAGAFVLSGTNTYQGGTTIEAGSLVAGSDAAFGSGEVTIQGGTVDVGGRTLVNAFTMTNGTLRGVGAIGDVVVDGGTLAPGNSPGLLEVSTLLLGGGATTALEIGGLLRGIDYDAINVTTAGGLTFRGTLSVMLSGDFEPGAGATFDLFDWTGEVRGAFGQLLLPTIGEGLEWNVAQLYTTGELSVAASAIPEPSAYAAIAGLVVFGGAWWRRRSTRAKRE